MRRRRWDNHLFWDLDLLQAGRFFGRAAEYGYLWDLRWYGFTVGEFGFGIMRRIKREEPSATEPVQQEVGE